MSPKMLTINQLTVKQTEEKMLPIKVLE